MCDILNEMSAYILDWLPFVPSEFHSERVVHCGNRLETINQVGHRLQVSIVLCSLLDHILELLKGVSFLSFQSSK